MPSGGSIVSATLSGRNFPVTADADANIKLGGYENEIQANGDGTVRVVKTRVPHSVDGIAVSVDASRGDHEFLQDLIDQTDEELIDYAVTEMDGIVYSGQGQITGEVQRSTQSSTIPITLSGPERLTQQGGGA